MTSNVIVPNGKTIVIGGLIDNEVDQSWDGLPFLSRLPWIGYLFRHTADSSDKKRVGRDSDAAHPAATVSRALNRWEIPARSALSRSSASGRFPRKLDGPNLMELLQRPDCPPRDPPPINHRAAPQR